MVRALPEPEGLAVAAVQEGWPQEQEAAVEAEVALLPVQAEVALLPVQAELEV